MMTAPAVRLAVMGAGLIGKRHIEHIVAETGVILHSVIDPSPGARDLALQMQVPWHQNFDGLAAGEKPDGLIIATPNHLHVENGLDAVAHGIPALIEKPIADDWEEGKRLIEAGEKAGVPLLTGHHRRHNAMVQQAKAVIDSGTLGAIISVNAFFWIRKPDGYYETEWRRSRSGGPVLLNLIHDVDLLRYFCGEIEEVAAFQSRAVRNHAADETTVIILKLASGALGSINVSDTIVAPWNWEQTTGENRAFPRTDQSCYQIGGTMGSLSVPRLEVWSSVGEPGWLAPFKTERLTAAVEDPLSAQIRQFCRVIRDGEAPLVSAREGLMTLAVIDAIQRAAETGQAVKVKQA